MQQFVFPPLDPRGNIDPSSFNSSPEKNLHRKKRKREKKRNSKGWAGKDDVVPLSPKKKKRHDRNLKQRRKAKTQKKGVAAPGTDIDPCQLIFE